jgi:hypothetical protein
MQPFTVRAAFNQLVLKLQFGSSSPGSATGVIVSEAETESAWPWNHCSFAFEHSEKSPGLPSALKTAVKDASADHVVVRSPRQVVVRSPSSPLSPSSQLPYFADCEHFGRVAHWGLELIQEEPLVKAFKAQHSKQLPVMHDYEILSVLLTGKLGDANFQ